MKNPPVRLDGSATCIAIKGATDTEVLCAYVREVLCPTLKEGDMVVIDNLAPHKNEETIALIEAGGATAHFLPAYPPDLNPIQKMGSSLFGVGRDSKQSAVLKNEGLIWNSAVTAAKQRPG